jgi:iron complex outermembrane receptor protein
MSKRHLFGLCVSAVSLHVTTVAAQESDALEEVTVTAQKIEQNIIDVPISITAIGAEEIGALRVQGVEDFVLSVPNVTYQKSSRDSGPQLSIRGVSGETGGAFSAINVSVDEVPFAMSNPGPILSMRSFDLEQVEVLRGPQGTLTGANALGGMLNMVTAKPDFDAFAANVTLDVGRFSTTLIKGIVNVPIGDTLALRGSLYKEDSDGVTKNVGPSGGSSSTDNIGGRLAARWKPIDALTIDASYTREEQEYGVNDHANIDQFDNTDFRSQAIEAIETYGGQWENPDSPFWGRGSDNNRGYVNMDYPEGDDFTYDLASLKATYDMGAHQVSMLYGYYGNSRDSSWDADRTELRMYGANVGGALHTRSMELRVGSSYEGPLNWVAGLAYYDENARYFEAAFTTPALMAFYGVIAEDDIVGDPEAYTMLDYVYSQRSKLKTRAAFANVFYDFTDRLHFSGGLRFTKVNARSGNDFHEESWVGVPLDGRTDAELVAAIPFAMPDGSSDEINPRIALNYDLSDNSSAYFQFATGFRPGVGNDVRAVAIGEAQSVADPEYVKNFELGLKGRFLDNRVNLAAAVFYMDYTDLQIGRDTQEPVAFTTDGLPIYVGYNANAGKAEVRGFELEAGARATDKLELRLGLGYADSVVEEIDDETFDPPLDMPGVRPWTASAAAIYETPLTSTLGLNVRADYRWQDKAWDGLFEDERFPGNFLPSFETLDLSVGVNGDKWTAQAYFENVLDEQYYTQQINWSYRPTVYFIPRMYGLRFTYNFR